jgi:hypothetical protein
MKSPAETPKKRLKGHTESKLRERNQKRALTLVKIMQDTPEKS